MSQASQLVQILKKALKAHGKTYADIARHLTLSEASIKRMFSEQHFSLRRLDQICQLIDLELTDLLQLLKQQSAGQLSQLTLEQEREIVADKELLVVAVCVLNRWRLQDILTYFTFDELTCVRHLARLDRLKMIDLLPRNNIKLKVAPNFKWREDGPIQRFYMTSLLADFFNSRFAGEDEHLMVLNGMLSASSNAVFQRKLQALAREFDELNNTDAGLPFEDRYGTSAVIALRPWNYGFFEQFHKNAE